MHFHDTHVGFLCGWARHYLLWSPSMRLSTPSCFYTVKCWKKKSLMLLTYTVRLLIHPSSTGGVNDVSSSPGHYKYNPLILNMNKAHEANNASLWLNGMMAFWMTHKKLCAPSLIFTKPRQKYGWTDQQTDRSSHRDLRVHVSSDSYAAENIVRGTGEGFEDRGWTYGH